LDFSPTTNQLAFLLHGGLVYLKNLAIDDPIVNIGTFYSENINKVLVFSNSGDYLATNLELNDLPTISVWYSSLKIPKPTINIYI